MNNLTLFIQNFFLLVFESAPWLLLGFLISGLIKVMVPTHFLHRHLGKKTVSSVIKGALIGAPLPLCSCSVIPVAMGVRKAGASKGATTSFLIASPETGVDSVAVTYALLGPLMMVIRPIAAVTTAIVTGLIVLFVEKKEPQTENNYSIEKEQSSCCSSKKEKEQSNCCSSKKEKEQSNCCSSKKEKKQSSCCSSNIENDDSAFLSKLKKVFQFGFIDLINDTAIWLLIGLIISAVVMTWVPAEFLEKWGASPYAYIIMALIGVPMYICATSSTPLAVGLLFAGVSPGAILVFLLAGPATNVGTLAMVKKVLGNKVLFIYLSSLISLSFIFATITDYITKFFNVNVTNQIIQEDMITPLSVISGLILLLLMAYVLYFRKFIKK